MTTHDSAPFRPAYGLGNRHAQTIWPAVARRNIKLRTHREVWRPDAAQAIDVVLLPDQPGQPGVLLLHGLEGSYRSSYMQGMLAAVAGKGWNGAVLEFRSCGPSKPEVPQLYHSGKVDEIDFVARALLRRWHGAPLAACGFSLGGNALLKWMGELGEGCPLTAAVGISVPFDLAACARCLDATGFFAGIYRRRFLRSLKRKACETASRHDVPFTADQVNACTTLHAFDDLVTAALFGFACAEDYWARNSSQRFLSGIAQPTLLIAAADDPFIPAAVLPRRATTENRHLLWKLTQTGGHTGFVSGSVLRPHYDAEDWALTHLSHWL